MKISLSLIDDQYPFKGLSNKRVVVRAILFNEQGEVCLHLVSRDDQFGKQEYFETPGGGVEEKETLISALHREIKEEVGCKIKVEEELGVVKDSYNLINRENENHFFLAKVLSKGDPAFKSEGDLLIKETRFYPIDIAIALMGKQEDKGVSILVKRRELPFLRLAKTRLNKYCPNIKKY